MSSKAIGRAITLSIALAMLAPAQQLPFQLSVTVGSSVVSVQNRSTVSLSSVVGQTQTARVKATYTGSGQVTISQQPVVIGSSELTAQLTETPPVTLNRGGSFSFDI